MKILISAIVLVILMALIFVSVTRPKSWLGRFVRDLKLVLDPPDDDMFSGPMAGQS